ncbi:MAG: PAS domain-containing sensor histidine kinase [Polyangiales bacterium]
MVETDRPPPRLVVGATSPATEQPYRLLVESVRDYAIFMLDPEGYVVSWNAGAERIKGYKAAEIIGQHFSRFYPEAERAAGKTAYELEVARREGRYEEEGWRVRSDGTHFWASVVITALRDTAGTLVGFAKVTRDLSERKKLEEERLRAAQAEEAVRMRDEFLSIASHELRTPLTALQLQLGSLREQMDASSPLMRKVERATRSSQRLADLVEVLLDVSRIATSELTLRLERCELGDLARDVIERYRESAQHTRCDIELVAPRPVVGHWDRLRVEQVVTNLLANALKYGAGKPVRVTVLADADNRAKLEMCDEGAGIPEDRIRQIFDRFERAAPLRHFGGLGLGLYVTREIVLAHGGTVTAENRPEGGACFRVELPAIVTTR